MLTHPCLQVPHRQVILCLLSCKSNPLKQPSTAPIKFDIDKVKKDKNNKKKKRSEKKGNRPKFYGSLSFQDGRAIVKTVARLHDLTA